MTGQDDQERVERRQQIIDGALAVFAEKGFDKATNQDIAEAAGIGSPGLIYHYFGSKGDLLREVIANRAAMLQEFTRNAQLFEMAPREALRYFGFAFLKALSTPENRRVFRVVMNESHRNPEVTEAWRQSSSKPFRSALVGYLAQASQTGKLRELDPEVAADCFLGPFVLYALSGMVFGDATSRPSTEVMMDTVVEIFMRGVEAA